MKDIKLGIYESLTPKQRIVASIDALARGDKDEEIRLIKTCRKLNYTMRDHSYCGKMEALRDLAIAIENDMRGRIVDFLFEKLLFDPLPIRDLKSLAIQVEISPECGEDLLGIKKAWYDFLQEEGIDPQYMEEAYSELRHSSLKWFIKAAETFDLEPSKHTAQIFKKWIRDYYDNAT